MQALWGPDSVLIKAGPLGGVITEESMGRRAFRAAEFPGGNMYTNARSIARMYAAMVSDVDGIRLLQPDTAAAMTVLQTNRSRMHGVPPELEPATRNLFNMSLGFWRSSPPVMPILGPASFGHPGSGGSLGAADPEARVAFGYVSNLWAATLIDTRRIELAAAVKRCLNKKVPQLGGDRRPLRVSRARRECVRGLAWGVGFRIYVLRFVNWEDAEFRCDRNADAGIGSWGQHGHFQPR